MSVDNREGGFRERLQRGDSYGLLLALIIVTYALMAVIELNKWGRVVIGALFGAILLLSLHTSHVRGKWIRIAGVFVAISVVINIFGAIVAQKSLRGTLFITLGLLIIAPFVVLTRILRHPVVNVETLLGAISAYALIGMAFAGIYAEMNLVAPHFFAQHTKVDAVTFLYFSFTVITTLGFGDLTPGQDIGRVLVTLEALFGQIFLVTLVARLVSQYGSTRVRE